jgi:hypothetical protein
MFGARAMSNSDKDFEEIFEIISALRSSDISGKIEFPIDLVELVL